MGCVLPQPGFLEGLRKICTQENILLIFDEVMTGFRLAPGGAQELFNVQPDLTTLGKIIGGGMPVGAYGGRKEIMDFVSPVGPVYQAGTLSGNPIAMSAGLSMLGYLLQHPDVYQKIENTTSAIVEGISQLNKAYGKKWTINKVGSMYTLFFTDSRVTDFDTAKSSDTVLFGQYFNHMLQQGVYLAPSQYESLFISSAIEQAHVEQILSAHKSFLESLINT